MLAGQSQTKRWLVRELGLYFMSEKKQVFECRSKMFREAEAGGSL